MKSVITALLIIILPHPFACYPAGALLRISDLCHQLLPGQNLYLPQAHGPSVLMDPPRDRTQKQLPRSASHRPVPYSLRSVKRAPQEDTSSSAPFTSIDDPLDPNVVGPGQSQLSLCTCAHGVCRLSNHAKRAIVMGSIDPRPPTAAAPLAANSPIPAVAPTQSSAPRPKVDQRAKASAFYQQMLAQGVKDTNAGKTEDEVVSQLNQPAPPSVPSSSSGLGSGLAAFGAAAAGAVAGSIASGSLLPKGPLLSMNPSLGGVSVNPSMTNNIQDPLGLGSPSDSAQSTTVPPQGEGGLPALQSTPQPKTSPLPTMKAPLASPESMDVDLPFDDDTSQDSGASYASASSTAHPETPDDGPVQQPTLGMFATPSHPNASPPSPRRPAPMVVDNMPISSITALDPSKARGRPSHKRSSVLVHIGDHSVMGSDLYPSLLYNDSPLTPAAPNYIRIMWSRLRDADVQFSFANNSVTVTSHVHPSAPGGGLEPAVAVSSRVLCYHPSPINQSDRRTLDVQWSEGHTESPLPLAEIMKFFVGGTISERAVTSAIAPKLQPSNINTVRNLADYLVESSTAINNMAMYAKLLWSAFVRDLYTYANLQPVAVPFPTGTPVTFVNLDDATLDYMNIVTPIIAGHIIMVDRADYTSNDLMAAYYLAAEGRRYDSNSSDIIPHAAYMRWPAINVTILKHGAASPAPSAVDVSAEVLIAFATKLAQQRNEMAQLVEAIYWVMDNAGIRYETLASKQAQYILPSLRTLDITIPRPQDYNVLLRLAGVRPPVTADAGTEATHYSTIRVQDRVRLVALYTSCFSTFLTTVLHSVQIKGSLITDWYAARANAASATQLMTQLNNITQPNPRGAEAPIYNIVKDCFPKFLGVEVARHTTRYLDWLGPYGSRPDNSAAFKNVPQDVTPRLYNPLTVDDFLNLRPREWGLVGPCPKADFSKEIVLQTTQANQGWRALLGSRDYADQTTGSMPYAYVDYGAFALNVIVQYLRPATQAVSCQSAYYVPGGHAEFAPPQIMTGPEYMPALHSFVPCTIMTWDAVTLNVQAVAIVGSQVAYHDLLALSNVRGQTLESAGLALSAINQGGGTYSTPPMLGLPNMLAPPPQLNTPPPATEVPSGVDNTSAPEGN